MRTLKPRVQILQRPKATVVTLKPSRIRGRALQTRNTRLLHYNPLCVHCTEAGRVSAAVEVDHVIPLWAGGEDAEHNLQGLCIPCHEAKSRVETAQRMACGQNLNGSANMNNLNKQLNRT